MPHSTKVSVIVPVFNAERHIFSTLDSLAKQTLPNIEIIIIDDASTDASQAVIKKYQNQSQLNIVYLCQPVNQGVHNARLLGLQHATGEWIGFVDADDTLQPVMYEKMLDAGVRESVDIVICGAYRVTENGKRLRTKVSFKKERKVTENVFQEFCEMKFGTGSLWNKLYRRDVIMPFKSFYFPWRQDTNEDVLMNLGCFSSVRNVLLIKDVLYNYTYNPKSASSQISSSKAYVNTFRAYAIAVSAGLTVTSEEKQFVTEMYRLQLARAHLQVQAIQTLSEYALDLVEAVSLVSKHYPLGLAMLSSRTRPNLSVREALKMITQKILLRLQRER